MMNENIAARVKGAMVEVLDLDLSPEQIEDELSLYSSSIRLDSLGFLHLILALEKEFNCQIDDEDVMNANLETVGDLLQLFKGKLAVKSPSERSVGRSPN